MPSTTTTATSTTTVTDKATSTIASTTTTTLPTVSSTTTTAPVTTTITLTTTNSTEPAVPPKSFVDPVTHAHGDASPPAPLLVGGHPPGTNRPGLSPSGKPTQPIIFDIFHNGQPTEAVVVGNKITLSFTPYYAIPRKKATFKIMFNAPISSGLHVYYWLPS